MASTAVRRLPKHRATSVQWSVGDVIEDSYGNPAVVLQLTDTGLPGRIMQTVGFDRGHVTNAPFRVIKVVDAERAEQARSTARDEWWLRRFKRSQFTQPINATPIWLA